MNGANTPIPSRAAASNPSVITATDQDGNDAMQFVSANRLFDSGQFHDLYNFIIVTKADAAWETIDFSVTAHGQTATLLLVNNLFEGVSSVGAASHMIDLADVDAFDEIASFVEGELTTFVTTYTYDLARRLVQEVRATDSGTTTTVFGFDARNNRVLRTVTGDEESYVVAYTYDLNNRLLQKTRTGDEPAVTTFTYDRNGNQLTQSVIAGSDPQSQKTLTYDAFNHLVRVEQGNSVSVYAYRADGLRHTKTVNGHTTTHVWDRGSIILEMNGSGAVVNRFSRGVGHLIRSYHHGFYLFNARTDVVQRVDSNGDILHTYRYDAFGNQLNGDEVNTNPFRFAGEYYDFETGFIYLRARFYNSLTGRMLSEDPHWNIRNMQFGDSPTMHSGRYRPHVWSIMQSGNLFVFAMNNPIAFIDPSGLNCVVTAQRRANQIDAWQNSPVLLDAETIHTIVDAARGSITVEVSYGMGFGGSTQIGIFAINIQGTTRHFAHVFSTDGVTSRVGMGAEISAELFSQIQAGAAIEVSSQSTILEMLRENGANIGPDREVEWFWGVIVADSVTFGNNSSPASSDFVLSFGASVYALVGGGVEVSFNVTEFRSFIRR